ncbi:hypothetical protein HK102_012242 [Quaeritorhiza haematococci]|nr:hypothetical protein HK102_012242 [Quaeritorhiza haematococci]
MRWVWLAAAGLAVVGYLVYFDQRRVRDPAFRKKIRKQKRKAAKARRVNETRQAPREASEVTIDLEALAKEPIPSTPEEREKYVVMHITVGDELVQKGPLFYGAAAACYFRALKVWPEPMQLLVALEQSCPAPVFDTIMNLMAVDGRHTAMFSYTDRTQDHNHFPPAHMNCKFIEVEHEQTLDGKTLKRRGLVVTKDFAEGDIIYREKPLIAVLDVDREGLYCTHCLRLIPSQEAGSDADAIKKPIGRFDVTFCSETCLKEAEQTYSNFLYSSNVPPQVTTAREDLLKWCNGERDTQQSEGDAKPDSDLTQTKATRSPLFVLKFMGRMVYEETAERRKLMSKGDGPSSSSSPVAALGKGSDYSTWDHLERLHAVDTGPPRSTEKTELDILKRVTNNTVPGLDSFLTETRYATLRRTFLYNAIGIRSSRSQPATKDREPVRSSASNPSEIIGAGLYHITSYAAHSCDPNAAINFGLSQEGNSTDSDNVERKRQECGVDLSLVALKPLKKGDEVYVSWIAAEGKELETRRTELKAKKFAPYLRRIEYKAEFPTQTQVPTFFLGAVSKETLSRIWV